MSDGVTTSNAQQSAVELRLSTELRAVRSQRAALELEVLNSRDFAIGQAAEIGTLRSELATRSATASIHDTNHREHISRLEDALRETSRKAAQTDAVRHELAALRTSATWKIGRAVMLPIRAAKRLLRRG